jgi:MinD-like ATPase involved in chromosome partitioning or flagellar assembly
LSAALADADLENADPGDFAGLDASDVGLQTALTVLADDISDAAEAAGDADGLKVLAAPGILRRASRLLRPAARTRRSSS